MKWLCISTFVFTLIFSCGKVPVIDNTFHTRIIKNDSDHSIILKRLGPFKITLSPNGGIYETKSCEKGHTLPKAFGYLISEKDSLIVAYDDTLVVIHGSQNYNVLRDLRRKDMFSYKTKRQDETITYTYTYSFTNEDYDEAKTK